MEGDAIAGAVKWPTGGRLELRRPEVEADADEICAKPANGGGVGGPVERMQSRLGIVIEDETSACWVPAAANPHPNIRVELDVAHVSRVPSLLGDDPTGRARDVHPHHRAPALACPASLCLDKDVARHEPRPNGNYHGWVQEIPLENPHAPSLALVADHWSRMPGDSASGHPIFPAFARSGHAPIRRGRGRHLGDEIWRSPSSA